MSDPVLTRLPDERRRRDGASVTLNAGCCCCCCCLHTVGSVVGVIVALATPATPEAPRHVPPPEPLRPPPPAPVVSDAVTPARPTLTDRPAPVVEFDEDLPAPARPALVTKPYSVAKAFFLSLLFVTLAHAVWAAVYTTSGTFMQVAAGLVCVGPVYLLAAWALTAVHAGVHWGKTDDGRHLGVVWRVLCYGVAGTLIGIGVMWGAALMFSR